MNTKALNSLADLICRAQENGKRTPMGIAMAIESAGRHMSPEVAAESEQLRARLDEVERKYTFDTSELKRQLETARVDGQRLIRAEQRRAELEAVLGSHRKDDQAEIERLRKRIAELEAERHSTNEALADTTVAQRRAEASADRLTQLLAPTQALHEDDAEVFVPRTERSHWVAIADALNAAHAAGMPVGVDLDGTLTDHNAWSVVWDRVTERWTVAGYEDAEAGDA